MFRVNVSLKLYKLLNNNNVFVAIDKIMPNLFIIKQFLFTG